MTQPIVKADSQIHETHLDEIDEVDIAYWDDEEIYYTAETADDLADGAAAGLDATAGAIAEGAAFDAAVVTGEAAAADFWNPAGVFLGALSVVIGGVALFEKLFGPKILTLTITNGSGAKIYFDQFWAQHGVMTAQPSQHIPANTESAANPTGTFGFQNTNWHTSGVAGVLSLKSQSFGDKPGKDGFLWIMFRIPEAGKKRFIAMTQQTSKYKDMKDFYKQHSSGPSTLKAKSTRDGSDAFAAYGSTESEAQAVISVLYDYKS